MAYLIGSYNFATPELDTSGSFTFDMPEHEADDLLIVIVTHRTNSTIAITGSFTERSTQAFTRGNRSAFFQKYISTPLSTATVTGGGSGFAVQVHVWRDADATTPVPQFAQQQETVNTNTSFSPSITTTSAWAAVCHAIAGWDNAGYYITADPTFYFMGRAHEDSAKVVSVYNAVVSAGVVPAHNWYIGGADGGTCYTYSVQNAAGGAKPFLYDSGITPVRRYGHMSAFESTTWVTLGSSITTLATLTVDTAAPSATSDTQSFANSSYTPSTMVTHNTTGTLWQGATHTITSADFSNGILSVTLGVRGINRTGVRGVCFIVFDSSGNWSAFNYPKSKILAELFGYTISVSASSAVYDSSGAVDWADITKVGYCWHGDSTSSSLRAFVVRDLVFCQNGVISGGSADSPASIRMLPSYFNQDQYIDHASLQGKSQTMVRRGVTFGDGTNDVYYNGQTQHFTLPSPDRVDYQVADSALDIEFYAATADSVIDLRAQIYEATSRQTFKFNALTHPDASCYFTGLALIGFDVEMADVLTVPSVSFIACPSIDGKAAQYSNCSITDSPSAGAAMILRDGGSFTNGEVVKADNVYAFEIPAAGDVDLSGTVFAGHTTDINVTAVSGTVNITTTGYSPTYTSAGATVNIIAPVATFTIESSEASSLIRLYESGTQTLLDSASGTSLGYIHSLETVDYTVDKAGFIPQRFTGKALSGNETVTVSLVADPVYDAANGLTYGADISYDAALKEVSLSGFGNTGRKLYSCLIDAFIAEASLRNTPFPLQMVGYTTMFMLDDNEFSSDADALLMTECGVSYFDSSDVLTASWCSVVSKGEATGFTGEYQQVAGSGTIDARAVGAFNQTIKYYGDATHGNFDYSGHLVLKFQPNTYIESRSDVVTSYGITALLPTVYVVAMEPIAAGIAAGDPAISVTLVDHTSSPLVVDGKSFDYELQDNGANSGLAVLREWNYNKSLDAAYQGMEPFNLPEWIRILGDSFETVRGYVEGGGLSGLYVSRGSADHPDFTRFMSNDGTYYTVPVTISVSAPALLVGSVVLLYNVTQDFVIEVTTLTGAGYSKTVESGVDFDSGDNIVLLATYQSGGVAKRVFRGSAQITSASITFTDSQADWSEPNTLALDGSGFGEFATDYIDVEVDVVDSDDSTEKSRIAAFLVNAIATEDGIQSWVSLGGSPVIAYRSATEAYIDADVATLSVKNSKSASKLLVVDDFILGWSDGVNRADAVVGSSIVWISPSSVLLQTVGDGPLTAPQVALLTSAATNSATAVSGISDVETKIDQSLVDTGTTIPDLISGISAGSAPTVEEIRAELDSNSTQLALILADTNELQVNQTNWTTATGFSTFDPDVNTIDDETWTESLTLIRASLNSATDDEAGNAVILSNDGSKPRLTYTYVAGQLDRSLVNVDAT